jgi:hypothetical protein
MRRRSGRPACAEATAGRRVVPGAEVAEDSLDNPRVVNDGDEAHGVVARGAGERVHVPDPRNQVAGGGMGIRGGAVCKMRAISAGVTA